MPVPVFKDYATLSKITDKHIVLQMDDRIYLHRSDVSPLLSFLVKNGGKGAINEMRNVGNMEFYWLTKRTKPPYVLLAQNHTANSGTLIVPKGDGVWFEVNTICYCDGLQFMVTDVTFGVNYDTLTVSLFPSTQTDKNISAGAKINIAYAVFGERANAPLGNFEDVIENFNYLEQMMKGCSFTRIQLETQKYGEDIRRLEHNIKLMAHKIEIENKFILSQMAKDTTNDAVDGIGTIWNTQGLLGVITAKVLDFNGSAWSYDLILASLPNLLEYSDPNDIIFYVPSSFLTKLNLAMVDKLWVDTNDKSFGTAVMKLNTPYGEFPLIRSVAVLDNISPPTALLINKRELKKVNFRGVADGWGEVELVMNAQAKNQPNLIHDYWRGITGLQWGWADKHAKIINWV
ncbi:MAG: hypothetical protein QXJ06_00575 [Candidatus Aenigmatarchaeota archaeon]